MPDTQIAKAHLFGMFDQVTDTNLIALTIYDLAGGVITSAAANYRNLRAMHSADVKRIKNQLGQFAAFINAEDGVEVTFDFIAQGSNRTNSGGTFNASAQSSARMPPVLSKVVVANAPVIRMGFLADALNAPGTTGTWPFIYFGGGSINGESEDAWSGSITVARFIGLPTWSVI